MKYKLSNTRHTVLLVIVIVAIKVLLMKYSLYMVRGFKFSASQYRLVVTHFFGNKLPHPPTPPRSRVIHKIPSRQKCPITAP